MKAVLLCGGMGTRIREASDNLPKPMLPIGGRPILWHIMKGYAAHGVNDFVLCLGYKSWVIKEFFINYHYMNSDIAVRVGSQQPIELLEAPQLDDWRVILAETGETTMTGGRVAAIRRYVEGDELFLLTYGDGVADVNINELVEFHRSHGKVATVTAVRPPGRFGELQLKGNHVAHFMEKPQTTEGFINGGFFVFDARRIWSYLGKSPETPLEAQPMQRLVADGQLAAFPHTGFWQPMDTLREYKLLNDLWETNQAPWRKW